MKPTTLESLIARIDWAGNFLKIPAWVIENELKHFKIRELTVDKIRVKRDDGSYLCVTATVALHANPYTSYEKPYKGGIRLSHTVTPDLIRSLAVEMTLKSGVADLDFGGAKAGIRLTEPASAYSPAELSRIIEAVADEFITAVPIISPRYYVPATDIGTTPAHMDIIHRKFRERTKGLVEGAAVTGRTVGNGGIPGREEATGRGGLVVLEHVLKRMPHILAGSTTDAPRVIVQGLGQVGGNFVRLAAERGMRIIGVGNAQGAVFRPEGIALDMLPRRPDGTLDGDSDLAEVPGEHLTSEDLLVQPCDILVPAAVENAITEKNADAVNAKVILELANHPVTEEADEILKKRGITVIPDILANAGGVSVSFWEWARSFGAPPHEIELPETEEEVRDKLTREMQHATDQVFAYAERYNCNLRDGAWLKAVHRISQAMMVKHAAWTPETPTRRQ